MLKADDILEVIKSRGYWRIHFRPTKFEKAFENNLEIRDFVKSNVVDFAGWDFPHYPMHKDETQQINFGDGFVQGLTLFGQHKEFWRFFQSGQFIFYLAFPEDWYEEHIWEDIRRDLETIRPFENLGIAYNIMANIKSLFTFIFRFVTKENIESPILVDVKLNNTENRVLWSQNFSWEVEYSNYKITSKIIHVINETVYSLEDILNSNQEIQIQCIRSVFDSFGWNPANEQIKYYLERLK